MIGVLVAADRICLVVAERMAADTLQHSQQLPRRPDVSIDGFPFLTQLAAERFGEIEVRLDDLVVGSGDRTVTLARVHLTLHDVHVFDTFHRATSRSGTATALITYAELSRVVGVPLSYAGSGRIVAQGSVTVAGESVRGTVSAAPTLSGTQLSFAQPQATVAGIGIPGADAALAALLARPIDLSSLPFGLHVDAIDTGAAGVSVTLSAANLSYRR
ncbi:MAG: DUF2993 domain-containing protein [Jatrophihabitans sp.]|nr:MAG: DUF2993 domain-containing protein [Jatrophihabitans sp.]